MVDEGEVWPVEKEIASPKSTLQASPFRASRPTCSPTSDNPSNPYLPSSTDVRPDFAQPILLYHHALWCVRDGSCGS